MQVCNIYVRSERAGKRVMESVKRFISGKLKLKVKETKSAVARPEERKFLGFSFTAEEEPRRRIAPKALDRFKERIREMTRRTRTIRLKELVESLARYLRGWRAYFGYGQTPWVLKELDSWIRHPLRAWLWSRRKRGRTRYTRLRERGIPHVRAAETACASRGPWRMATHPTLHRVFGLAYFQSLGLPSLVPARL